MAPDERSGSTLDFERPWGRYRPTGMASLLLRASHALPADSEWGYRLSKLLRAPLKRGAQQPYDVEINGLRLRLVNSGNYCETRLLFGPQFYDVEELQWLEQQLRNGGTFLDVGSNAGLYSLHLAGRLRERIAVHAIEPDPEMYQRMRFNAEANGLTIALTAAALSDFEGSGALTIDARQRGQNALSDAQQADGQISVDVRTLRSICAAACITEITALKIDVEGHEHRVLDCFFAEAPATLWPRALLIERVHDQDGLVERIIRDRGYRVALQSKRNVMLRYSGAEGSGAEGPTQPA